MEQFVRVKRQPALEVPAEFLSAHPVLVCFQPPEQPPEQPLCVQPLLACPAVRLSYHVELEQFVQVNLAILVKVEPVEHSAQCGCSRLLLTSPLPDRRWVWDCLLYTSPSPRDS
eukprot:TRINITY_DN988_c0_g1_i1.p1 TRINITY_DN988_c0_g1~~TRINITY_DN988_c0_g1_i1.p1  ORF type:complete len:114 (-),score=14.88 TRINITY_DN988_c0_g1_i1:50-391(-)